MSTDENATGASEFTRRIEFTPAYDKRSTIPGENYGIQGLGMKFLLTGPRGVIRFVVYTMWHLKHVRESIEPSWPIAADISYHSPVPTHDGQMPVTSECRYLNNRPCYYDCSLCTEQILEILIEHGEGAMWRELEKQYHIHLERGGNE